MSDGNSTAWFWLIFSATIFFVYGDIDGVPDFIQPLLAPDFLIGLIGGLFVIAVSPLIYDLARTEWKRRRRRKRQRFQFSESTEVPTVDLREAYRIKSEFTEFFAKGRVVRVEDDGRVLERESRPDEETPERGYWERCGTEWEVAAE